MNMLLFSTRHIGALAAAHSITAALSLISAGSLASDDESDYYAVDYLTPPNGAVLEVGGMEFMPDGRLVVSTRRGEVWIVENPLAEDPSEAKFSLFADGLWEGLGLNIHDGQIYVVQRGELSRLTDIDGDTWLRSVAANPNGDVGLVFERVAAALH